jgi:hypothetical protein
MSAKAPASLPHRGTRATPPVCAAGLGCGAALAAFCLALVSLGCTGQPPEILRVFWQINLVEDKEQGQVYESLSLFVRPRDPDGFDDIEEVYLINDAEELFWRLDRSSWRRSGSGEETWIGGNGLRLPDGRAFPGGEYRILLRDVGGDTAEQTVQIQAPPVEQVRSYLPEVSVHNGSLHISGGADSYQLWLYDAAGNYTGSRPAARGTTTLGPIVADNPALRGGFSLKVYSYIQSRNLGVLSGPYFVGP